MEINKKDPKAVKEKIQELKNEISALENKITTIQHITARFSMRYGESEEQIDKLLNDIAELNKQIKYLTNNELLDKS